MDAQQANNQNELAQLAQLVLAIDNIPDDVFAEIDFAMAAWYQIPNFELAILTSNDTE